MYSVLVFGGEGAVKERRLELHINEPSVTVARLRKYLTEAYPLLKDFTMKSLIAINQEMATSEEVVYPADEIALIPPLSGG